MSRALLRRRAGVARAALSALTPRLVRLEVARGTSFTLRCTDDNRCTHADQCTQGTCAGATAPLPDCRTASRNVLLVKDRSADSQDQIASAWRKGSATTLADFGDPVLGTTSYAVCLAVWLYDETAPETWAVRSAIDVPPGGVCREKP